MYIDEKQYMCDSAFIRASPKKYLLFSVDL